MPAFRGADSPGVGSSSDYLERMLSARVQANDGALIGDELYGIRSKNHRSNLLHVRTIMEKHPEFFEPIIARYPKFDVMMARLLVNSFGFGVGRIAPLVKLVDFKDHHSETVAKSVATLLQKRKTAGLLSMLWENSTYK